MKEKERKKERENDGERGGVNEWKIFFLIIEKKKHHNCRISKVFSFWIDHYFKA